MLKPAIHFFGQLFVIAFAEIVVRRQINQMGCRDIADPLSVSGKVIAKTDYMSSSSERGNLYYYKINKSGNAYWALDQQAKPSTCIVRPVSEI